MSTSNTALYIITVESPEGMTFRGDQAESAYKAIDDAGARGAEWARFWTEGGDGKREYVLVMRNVVCFVLHRREAA